jgi:hypothetical protein
MSDVDCSGERDVTAAGQDADRLLRAHLDPTAAENPLTPLRQFTPIVADYFANRTYFSVNKGQKSVRNFVCRMIGHPSSTA